MSSFFEANVVLIEPNPTFKGRIVSFHSVNISVALVKNDISFIQVV